MDDDTKSYLENIRDDIRHGHAQIGAKIDVHIAAFQAHKEEDIRVQSKLEAGQDAIRRQLEDRQRESDVRRQKSLAELAGRYALWAAVLSALALWILEHFISKK